MWRFWMEGLVAAPFAVSAAVCAVAFADVRLPGTADLAIADLVEQQAASFSHRSSGEFTQDGRIVTAPLVTVTIPRTLVIMRHQVTAAEYGRCVEAGACR
jgi:formylglycine-generating enzyme required for sulfatase activity